MRYNLLMPGDNPFVGWENYAFFFTDPAFNAAIVNTLLLVGGLLFLIFGADVAIVARRDEPKLAQVRLITALDAIWVVGSLAVLAVFSGQLSTLGFWLVAIQALFVADFAILQFLGIRQRTRGADALAAAA